MVEGKREENNSTSEISHEISNANFILQKFNNKKERKTVMIWFVLQSVKIVVEEIFKFEILTYYIFAYYFKTLMNILSKIYQISIENLNYRRLHICLK